MKDTPIYLNEKQVAEITGFALSTLRNNLFHCRGIPYVKIGKSVRYRRDEVIEYMERYKISTEG